MDKVFHIRTFSSPNGAYQEVELDLPATDYELLDTMEQLRLEDGKHPYLEFHAVEEYDYLNERIQETDIFPLNALAKRLAELDTRGMAVFEGLVCMDIQKGVETIPIGSLIDYAYSGECCHVLEDAVTDEELGRFLVENGFIPETDAIPDATLELLDYAQIGKNHREAEGSTFTGFGYVERHSEPRQIYKTLDLTPKKPAYTILAETYDGNRVEFPYPANAPMGTEPVRCVDCTAPSLIGLTSGMETVDLLARRLAGLEPKALTAYKALLEATDCKDILSAGALMDSLDNYVFSPQYSSPIEVAKGELSLILCEPDAATLAPHLNLYQYGQALIEKCGGVLTPYGLIEPRGPHMSPAERVMWGAEEQGSERSFRLQAETEVNGLCDDAGQPVQGMEESPQQGGMEMK